jgi:hypothetical protein
LKVIKRIQQKKCRVYVFLGFFSLFLIFFIFFSSIEFFYSISVKILEQASIFRDPQRIAQQRSWSPNDDIKLLVSIINIFHLFTDARQFLGVLHESTTTDTLSEL